MRAKMISITRIALALGAVAISFAVTLALLNWYGEIPPQPMQSARGPLVHSVAELPPFAQTGAFATNWDIMDGLDAQQLTDLHLVDGQPVEKLTVLPDAPLQRIGIRFSGLTANNVYRVTSWVKPVSTGRIVMEVRDGLAARDGTFIVDFPPKTAADPTGNIESYGMEMGPDGWLKPWADFRPSNPYLFATINVSVNQQSPHQQLILGGVQVDARP